MHGGAVPAGGVNDRRKGQTQYKSNIWRRSGWMDGTERGLTPGTMRFMSHVKPNVSGLL